MSTVKIKKEHPQKAELIEMRKKTAKPLLWIGIVSIVMLFAGLTSAYVVRADNGNWLVFHLPPIAIISTAIIVASSLTMLIAQFSIRKDKQNMATLFLFITFVLGLAFTYTQYAGWKELTAQGIYFLGKYSNASGSFLYLIALMHLFHLFGGLFALLITLTKSIRKCYSSHDHLGIELAAIYWHFLDVLWIYLFLFLYFFR
ncbi:MAG: cytochrome c oxidase subunit 3 [Sphingobacteriaceae bacterium]|nr:cytochrome c oxidase subunit 3 [Sphingobacteriaceae bacterium]